MVTDSTLVPATPKLPPAGTKAVTLDQLAYKPDLRITSLCTEFCTHVYRISTKAATPESYQHEMQRVRQIAKIYGYEAEVFSTPQQQAVIFHNDHNIIVTFEGSRLDQVSHYNRNLLTYLRFKFSDAPKAIGGKIHYGFNGALEDPILNDSGTTLWQAVDKKLMQLHTEKPNRKVYFAGHSAGGAIATIATSRCLDQHPDLYIEGLYTFGQPRVGDRTFKDGLERQMKMQRERLGVEDDHRGPRYFRFEQYGDPMPALPPKGRKNIPGEYVHGGQWIPMDMDGHILAMDDAATNPREDTLSRTNPGRYAWVTEAYGSVLGKVVEAIRAARKRMGPATTANPEDADIKALEDQSLTGTFSGLLNLFSLDNYLHHEMSAYRRGIIHYREAHPSAAAVLETKEADAQHLLWRMINLSEHLQIARDVLPAGHDKEVVSQCERSVQDVLDAWEFLMGDKPRKLLRGGTTHRSGYFTFWQEPVISEERGRAVVVMQGEARLTQISKLQEALEKCMQSLDLSGNQHEEVRTLKADVSSCLNVAQDVVGYSLQSSVRR